MKKRRVLSALLAALLLLTGCAATQKTMQTVTKNGVMVYDGIETRQFSVPEGETWELHIAVNRLGGRISITVVREESGESVYRGADIPASDFTVALEKPGTYRAEISAEDFQGSYGVSCTEQGGTQ